MHRFVTSMNPLTDRQWIVLQAVYGAESYDYSSTPIQDVVANMMDVTGSTVAEHL